MKNVKLLDKTYLNSEIINSNLIVGITLHGTIGLNWLIILYLLFTVMIIHIQLLVFVLNVKILKIIKIFF